MICGSEADSNIIREDFLSANNDINSLPPSMRAKAERFAAARRAAAKSKTGVWGPTHSYDSDDSSYTDSQKPKASLATTVEGENAHHAPSLWEQAQLVANAGMETAQHVANAGMEKAQRIITPAKQIDSIYSRANTVSSTASLSGTASKTTSGLYTRTTKSLSAPSMCGPSAATNTTPTHDNQDDDDDVVTNKNNPNDETTALPPRGIGDVERAHFCAAKPPLGEGNKFFSTPPISMRKNINFLADIMGNACSPCSAQDLEQLFRRQEQQEQGQRAQQYQQNHPVPQQLSQVQQVAQQVSQEVSQVLQQHPQHPQSHESNEVPLGISRMEPPEDEKKDDSTRPSQSRQGSVRSTTLARLSQTWHGRSTDSSIDSPADRRRYRHFERQRIAAAASVSNKAQYFHDRQPSVYDEVEVTSQKVMVNTVARSLPNNNDNKNNNNKPINAANGGGKDLSYANTKQEGESALPCRTLTVRQDDAIQLERSISELTMRSSHGGVHSRLSENRRMAYYAVGRNHRMSGRGGNRRCYFTGKLIMSGAPFYAGIVQQGLRTLVVFCLPSALGLPKGVDDVGYGSSVCSRGDKSSMAPSSSDFGSNASPGLMTNKYVLKDRYHSSMNRSGRSVFSSVDEMSMLSDIDPNWGLDKDFLLQVLPDPGPELLQEMARLFPEQFETLPLQVREASCWRLYVKFCFFSGLPIAEGELHYKVREEISNEVYGEEIVLSHDVMEAVNGTSAEILRLPNQKTFRYLRKHYTQQSGKLSDIVFLRTSWELVRAEV